MTLYSLKSLTCSALVCALVAAAPSVSRAVTISYGDFGPVAPGVMFLDVEEDSGTDPTPLYGPPSAYSVGLDFDPKFTSAASGGASDITDGQLNFTLMGTPGWGVGSITISEGGDYTLLGAGGAATSVNAGIAARATILEVNGAPVAPIAVPTASTSFTATLPPAAVATPWDLGLLYDFGSVLGGNQVATKVEIVINNVLGTTSEAGSAAFIAKKDFRIDVEPLDVENIIPEPTSVLLAGLALCGVVVAARRHR